MNKYFQIVAIASPLAFLQLIPTTVSGQSTDSEDENQIDNIVVTGTQVSIDAERAEIALTPGGINLIDMEEFRERNVSNLADVLQYVPGVWSSSDSGNDAIFFSSRGSNLDATDWDMNGIKLIQDGLPVTTADGNNHNRIIDPLSARHATVARGSNALKYGASTLGGAISFVSPTAHDFPALDLSLNVGSHGQLLGRVTASKLFDERLDGLITVEGKQWDGFRDHNEQNRFGVYANAGWKISDFMATRFYATYLDNNQELPGSLTRAEFEENPNQASGPALGGNYQLNVETWRLANKTTWQFDDKRRLDIGFSIEEQTLFHPIVDRILVDFDGPGPAPPVEVFSLLIDTDHRDIGVSARYNQQVGHHDLLFGLNYGQNSVEGGHFRNLGGVPNGLTTLIDNSADVVELFAMDRWQISDRMILVLAAQTVSASREVRNLDVASALLRNPSDDYSSINPRLGVIYQVREEISLYANASHLFEPPTNFELEDNVLGGEATLRAMKGPVIEVGSRGSGQFGADNSWAWDLSFYYAWIEDEILSVDDPMAPGTSLVTNVDDTIHAGIEAFVSFRFPLDASTEQSIEPLLIFSFNEFSFDNDVNYGNNDLPAAPEYAIRGEILYRNGDRFFIGPTFELVRDRYADFVNSYTVDSYTLLGLRGGWSNKHWTIYADVRNILDEDYVANQGVRNIADPDAPILNPGQPFSVYVGIGRQFK